MQEQIKEIKQIKVKKEKKDGSPKKEKKTNIEDEVIKIQLIQLSCSCEAERYKDCYCYEGILHEVDYEDKSCEKLRKNTKFVLEGLQDVFNDLDRMLDFKKGTEEYFRQKTYRLQFVLLQELLIDQVKMKTKVKDLVKDQQKNQQKDQQKQKRKQKSLCDKCQQPCFESPSETPSEIPSEKSEDLE